MQNKYFDKERRERRLERGKNDHRNPAGNRTRDLSLYGRLLYQLSYWARSDSDQITEPLFPSPAEKNERKIERMTHFHTESTDVPGRPTQWNPLKLEKVGVCGENIFIEGGSVIWSESDLAQ